MITLLEHEGKSLLVRNGFAVPSGALWPALPTCDYPLVAKAQVPVGGRGKAGGIAMVDDAAALETEASRIAAMQIGGHDVRAVYIEERIEAQREFYVCAMVDRDRGCPVLIACAEGGVEIESVPRERIAEVAIDPLIGLRGYALNSLLRGIGCPEDLAGEMRKVLTRLHDALIAEDAEQIEINPLILDAKGRLIAADAKVLLDEDAGFRHPGREAEVGGSAFERSARELGAIGIELDGNVAAMMNGAGMTMATLDELTALGGKVGPLVELHGVMTQGPERVAEIVELLLAQKPAVLFCNIYFQFRRLDDVAEGIVSGLKRIRDAGGTPAPIVVRMAGVKEAEAREILGAAGIPMTDNFAEACDLVIAQCNHSVKEGV
ncbi:ATP-grasp domain-containing protein [Alloyangia pacifica]|uniref:Succinyl-CoA synthetase beta subunit n=1 Tax=Alloyangia pacifica TaxID=311180 RepID=A0A1I6WPM0_9RHOB|nr:ATP-grasp domain-containing protein [Alloyangia pacifica]SDI99408.1 succinyl-CoA synthetase beta subunit [Alloyangia pacifica]SFT27611.1 succinyl-CoA synthetase beta subunit [Alloyangia pacifica]